MWALQEWLSIDAYPDLELRFSKHLNIFEMRSKFCPQVKAMASSLPEAAALVYRQLEESQEMDTLDLKTLLDALYLAVSSEKTFLERINNTDAAKAKSEAIRNIDNFNRQIDILMAYRQRIVEYEPAQIGPTA